MKLSRNTRYVLAGFAFVVILALGLTIFASSQSTKSVGIVDPTLCEFCRGKLNKSGECSRCIGEMGLEPYRAKRESKKAYNSPLIARIVVSTLAILIVVHVGLIAHAYYSKRKKAEVFYHTRCGKCGRKLRYRASQINHLGKCPVCQKALHFPEPPQMPKQSRWPKISWRKIKQMVWD
jgi:phage FluMu protein Com